MEIEAQHIDLQDLVDQPRETLNVELKSHLDLSENLHKAGLARHICALANSGGGYVVFGFDNDASPVTPEPEARVRYHQDIISSVVATYLSPDLSPEFLCEVLFIDSEIGNTHPVIRVPSISTVPICAKKNGPNGKSGKPKGIVAPLVYVRRIGPNGPESAAVSRPEDWGRIIRRCTLNDRESLLKDVAVILRNSPSETPEIADVLESWHLRCETNFRAALDGAGQFSWPVPLDENRYQLTYLILHDSEAIPIHEMDRILDEINHAVRDTVWTGWSMFYRFTREEIRPKVLPENSDGTGGDVFETNLIGHGRDGWTPPDFWRISPDGRASLIRGYREDVRTEKPGQILSPETVLRETAELVRHARAFAQYFPSASAVRFRCTWKGLHGREIADMEQGVYWSPGRSASAHERTVEFEFTLAEISANWPKVVAELGCPILHLFGFSDCSPSLVQVMAPSFVKLPRNAG